MIQINPIKITKEGERWLARFQWSHETKERVKQAGWFFSPTEKLWYTRDPIVAATLSPDAIQEAREMVARTNASIAASRATSDDIEVPAPDGLSYLPFQLAGISYARAHKDVLIGDEMGLGKTIQAIGLINADSSIRRVLIVCPASLKINWSRELHKWLVHRLSIAIADGQQFPYAEDVVIINYDVLHKHRKRIDQIQWDLLVVDECHSVKNQDARRTQALYGSAAPRRCGTSRDPAQRTSPIRARRRVYMTGTPIVNRPKELWTLVHEIDPEDLGKSFFKFHMRYCDAQRNSYGWDFSGASNLEELQTGLRSRCMIRRLKADVLKELPPKRRQIIMVPSNGATATVERERTMFQRAEDAARKAREHGEDEYAAAMRMLGGRSTSFEEMSELRHATAVAKIPHIIEHVKDCLDNTDKLVVFVHHHDVAHALKDAFPDAAMVTGEVAPDVRTAQVDRFQHDPNCRVFIGSIMAAGVGLTLTAAQLAVFAELDWAPGNISEAEDRLHRIGQIGSVLIQHLVFVDSVDSYMANLVVAKQETITAGLDARTAPIEAPEPIEQIAGPYLKEAPGRYDQGRAPAEAEVDSEVPF